MFGDVLTNSSLSLLPLSLGSCYYARCRSVLLLTTCLILSDALYHLYLMLSHFHATVSPVLRMFSMAIEPVVRHELNCFVVMPPDSSQVVRTPHTELES